jgi:hypothetical protein
VIDDGPDQELPFTFKGDVVGALRRGQRRDDDAEDGDGNDNTDRDHDAHARAIPIVVGLLFGAARATRCRQNKFP